jgi:Fe2+ transport system protein FeoA
VGLPDCISQGRSAARRIAALVAGRAGTTSAVPAPSTAGTGDRRLLEVGRGEGGRVTAVPADVDDLAREGIRIGSEVLVQARVPLGGPIVVRLGRARVAVPRAIASQVRVEASPSGLDR